MIARQKNEKDAVSPDSNPLGGSILAPSAISVPVSFRLRLQQRRPAFMNNTNHRKTPQIDPDFCQISAAQIAVDYQARESRIRLTFFRRLVQYMHHSLACCGRCIEMCQDVL